MSTTNTNQYYLRVCHSCKRDFDTAAHRALQLPCMHTMCATCVFEVPSCFVPVAGVLCDQPVVPQLCVPFVLPAEMHHPCDECAEPNTFATAHCSQPQCQLWLCTVHAEAHRLSKRTRDHALELFNAPNAVQVPCIAHPERSVMAECSRCNLFLCPNCIAQGSCGNTTGAHDPRELTPETYNSAHVFLTQHVDSLQRMAQDLHKAIARADDEITSQHLFHVAATSAFAREISVMIQDLEKLTLKLRLRALQLSTALTDDLKRGAKTLWHFRDQAEVTREHILAAEQLVAEVLGPSAPTPTSATAASPATPNTLSLQTIQRARYTQRRVESLIAKNTRRTFVDEFPVVKWSTFLLEPQDYSNFYGMDLNGLGKFVSITAGDAPLLQLNLTAPVVDDGSDIGDFQRPTGLALSSDQQYLFVADQAKQRLIQFSLIDHTVTNTIPFTAHIFSITLAMSGNGIWCTFPKINCLRFIDIKSDKDVDNHVLVDKLLSVAQVPRVPDLIVTTADPSKRVMRIVVDMPTKTFTPVWTTSCTEIKSPSAVLVDETMVFVSDDVFNVVWALSLTTGDLVGAFGMGNMQSPAGLAMYAARNVLIVAENDCMSFWRFDRSVANAITAERLYCFGSFGKRPGQFDGPMACVLREHVQPFNQRGDLVLHVLDTGNNRLQTFSSQLSSL